jgi:hypothetical protein
LKCTATVINLDLNNVDENRIQENASTVINPDQDNPEKKPTQEYIATVTNLDLNDLEKSRIQENKDITVCQEKKSSINRQRLTKLVIPLEPTFDDCDFDIPPLKENNPISINSETLTVSAKQSPVLTKRKCEQKDNVLRKVRKISGKSRMTLSSPQRTITDWIKNSTGCGGQSVFQLEAGCRDDVDGEPVYKMTKSDLNSVALSSNGQAKNGNKQSKVVKSYPKRERKRYNPDPMWTFVSETHKSRCVDHDESSKDSSVIQVLEEEEKSLMDQKSRIKRKTAASVSAAKSGKRRKVSESCSGSSRLKQTLTKSRQKSAPHSLANSSVLSFCSGSNVKLEKDVIRTSSDPGAGEEGAGVSVSDGNDRQMQEMMDRKLAEELAMQYDMEVKSGYRFFKLKGTADEYNFRRRPKTSS